VLFLHVVYRSVFDGSYVRKPRTGRVRGSGTVSVMRQDIASFTALVVLLLSVILVM